MAEGRAPASRSRMTRCVRTWVLPDPALAELQLEDCTMAAFNAAMNSESSELPWEVRRGLDLIQRQQDLYKEAGQEAERNWVTAAEAALAKNRSTFAVLPMNVVLNPWIYLVKLKEKGYVVEAPGIGPTDEDAGPFR